MVPIGTPPAVLHALRVGTKHDAYWYAHAFETTRRWWYRRITQQVARQFLLDQPIVVAAVRRAHTPTLAVVAGELAANSRHEAWRQFLYALYAQVAQDFARRVRAGLKADLGPIEGKAPPHPLPDPARHPFGAAEDWWARDVVRWLGLEAGKKIAQITETTRREIRARLAVGVSKGESIDQLAKRIRGLYDEYYRGRSVTIARTEVIAASNLGSRAAALSTGLQLDHIWLATMDGRTRSWHAGAEGQTQPIDTPYTVLSEQLMFPGDGSLGASGANLVNCRCTEGYSRA